MMRSSKEKTPNPFNGAGCWIAMISALDVSWLRSYVRYPVRVDYMAGFLIALSRQDFFPYRANHELIK